ncbi:hypothetical protein [Flavobacterium sp. UMI-01]|uniref:hypothetical protein n=1 Tax=Flavobacterium sp. UMI-01 TaxID=1441053 RepID=UPI001C7CC7C4|nr:hypothetical protein [Flavobacterium sp. UMI-01]GIZ09321.1 hypothetical protein FUMI01_20480 [Flavobacterium sp. UMI-01]
MKQKLINNKVFCENIKSLIKLSEDSLNLIDNQNSVFMSKLTKGEADENWLDESAHLANSDWILLNSIFISMFSHFEFRLFRLCKILEKESVSKIKIEHLSGSGITKFYNYLNLVGNIKSANKNATDFNEIQKFQKIRNLITHNGGIILTDKNKDIIKEDSYKFLKGHKVVVAGNLGIIRITKTTFLEYFANLIFKIINEITEEININFT